ncbi:hypothetical protein HUH30_003873 [Salmonella enterica]|nr:hypothetical protein [Salmonella enterica subsp. enterica]EDX2437822.1 hypothetical protein [Salmonella enterica subsp. enterica serovar Koenigstuhl]EFU3138799.1 hypothetical protein [Salmonella enterica]EHM6379457.1 hypothetical protein [Salmonella enterica]
MKTCRTTEIAEHFELSAYQARYRGLRVNDVKNHEHSIRRQLPWPAH